MIRRIRVAYRLQAPDEAHETVERVHAMHKRFCPVYRSISGSIDVSTELEVVPGPG